MDRKCCIFCDEIPADRCASTGEVATAKSAAPMQSPNTTCHREGPVTRNPFLNFMRYKRRTSCAHSIVSMAREAANEWNKMTDMEKCPYVMEAHKAPKRYRRRLDTLLANSMSDSLLANSTMKNETSPRSRTMKSSSMRRRGNNATMMAKPVKRLNASRRKPLYDTIEDFGNMSAIRNGKPNRSMK